MFMKPDSIVLFKRPFWTYLGSYFFYDHFTHCLEVSNEEPMKTPRSLSKETCIICPFKGLLRPLHITFHSIQNQFLTCSDLALRELTVDFLMIDSMVLQTNTTETDRPRKTSDSGTQK